MSEQKIRFEQTQRDAMGEIDVESDARHARKCCVGAEGRAAGIPGASRNCYRAGMHQSAEYLDVRRKFFISAVRQAWTHHERGSSSAGVKRLACCRTKQRQLTIVKAREIRDEAYIPVEVVRNRSAAAMQVAHAIAVRRGRGAPERISEEPLDFRRVSLRVVPAIHRAHWFGVTLRGRRAGCRGTHGQRGPSVWLWLRVHGQAGRAPGQNGCT